jgi:alkanesulfonate monooxygenase SsuD/methylene tetrahydromethanopterin reductase-like flavin-dependent oxidoreductase (luciferase family)
MPIVSGDNITFKHHVLRYVLLRPEPPIYEIPEQPVPIYVAANGPKSARLAGEIGDGWITTPANLANPDLRHAFRARAGAAGPVAVRATVAATVAAGALSVGKEPGRMPIILGRICRDEWRGRRTIADSRLDRS